VAAVVTGWLRRLFGERWIVGAQAQSDGLLLPGKPRGRAADLLLTPGGVTVFAGDRSADLAWEDHRRVLRGGRPAGWQVGNDAWLANEIGISLLTWGDATTVTMQVRRMARSWRTGIPVPVGAGAVPLAPFASAGLVGQCHTIDALCTVLAERPAVRDGLADLRRTRPLAAALAASRLGPRVESDAWRRSTIEVTVALKALGFVHRLNGRPVPGDPLPDRAEAEARIHEYLAHNPYARGVPIGHETVARLVRSEYLDVAPWPFHALMREAP
jgi:hypothetical protein